MICITTAQVKSILGISDSTYDTAIASAIPRIDSIVKRITKNRYNLQLGGTTTTGSADVYIYSAYAYNGVQCFDTSGYIGLSLADVVTNGQMVEGTGIASGAYVVDVFSNGIAINGEPTIRLSAVATASGDITIMTGIPVDLQTVIAQGVWYLVGQDPKIAKDDNWTSKSMGPLSISRGSKDSARLDGASGMPLWFVNAFPSFMGAW
jgi:hypothetical protein